MRLRRLPLMMAALRRSFVVIESMMVSTRLNCFSSTEPASFCIWAKGPTEGSIFMYGLHAAEVFCQKRALLYLKLFLTGSQ